MNRYTLGALVERHGGIVRQLPTVIDTPEAVRAALDAMNGSHRECEAPSGDSRTGTPQLRRNASRGAGAAPGTADLLIFCGGSSVGERDL